MQLELRERRVCAYDLLSFGEVMLRLDPGDVRIKTSRSFRVWEGGRGIQCRPQRLAPLFRLKTAVATAFADNEVGLIA
jgi:2-dehydro-3-deoxygluconokinase